MPCSRTHSASMGSACAASMRPGRFSAIRRETPPSAGPAAGACQPPPPFPHTGWRPPPSGRFGSPLSKSLKGTSTWLCDPLVPELSGLGKPSKAPSREKPAVWDPRHGSPPQTQRSLLAETSHSWILKRAASEFSSILAFNNPRSLNNKH